MPLFVAVLARTRTESESGVSHSWRTLDIDLTDMVDLEHLASSLDRFALSATCVVSLIEGENWFGIASIHDGASQLFASELGAALASECGDLFHGLSSDPTYGWGGDPALLEYFGVPADMVRESAEVGLDPELALTEIAETAGCAALVDSAR